MDSRHLAEGFAPVWLVAATLGPVGYDAQGISPHSPDGLVRCFEISYEGRDLESYGGLFTSDFRFLFGDPDLARKYPGGWTREDEGLSARHLFEGFRDASGVYRPPAQRIELTLRPFHLRADPEKPDSAAWYRVVDVPAVRLAIWTEAGNFLVQNDHHELWLVRGDAARLDAAQAADAGHWYVRRWVENPAAALAAADPDAVLGLLADSSGRRAVGVPAARPGVALGAPLRPAIDQVWPNPSRGTLALSFALPGKGPASVTVVDVTGRIRVRRPLGVLGPGAHRLALDLGDRIGPGVYWIRLAEGDRSDTRRVVLVP